MADGHQFREDPAHEAEKRFARAVLTGCVVPVLEGLAYAIALFGFPSTSAGRSRDARPNVPDAPRYYDYGHTFV